MLRTLLLVGAGGAFGSICRYSLSILMNKWNMHAAWATFAANAIGCLIIGLLIALFSKMVNEELRLLLMVGFCGGFTTFSTFSADAFALIAKGEYVMAGLYVFGSIATGFLALVIGSKIVA
jgi:CrcB protein